MIVEGLIVFVSVLRRFYSRGRGLVQSSVYCLYITFFGHINLDVPQKCQKIVPAKQALIC